MSCAGLINSRELNQAFGKSREFSSLSPASRLKSRLISRAVVVHHAKEREAEGITMAWEGGGLRRPHSLTLRNMSERSENTKDNRLTTWQSCLQFSIGNKRKLEWHLTVFTLAVVGCTRRATLGRFPLVYWLSIGHLVVIPLGGQICAQSGPDWSQMEQIWDFLRWGFSTFLPA